METATDKGAQTLLDKRLLKVLLVDDEATDRIPVERILRTCSSPVEFTVESAVRLSEAIKNLTEKQYDVILLDLELPDCSGIEILHQVVKVAPDIPVVVLTELDDEQTGFSALEDGATDYLVKDLPLDVVLVRTIVYAIQRKKIQMQSLKLAHDNNERMKELNCLYGISKLVETPGISLEEMLEKTVRIIPAGWQYPDIACARIVFEGKEYKTDNFKPSKWTQSVDITLQGQKVGTVEVCYIEERPQSDEGPFLEEKWDLIDAIGERLGKMAERDKAEETQKRLVALIEATPDFVGFADAKDKHIIYVNKAGRKMCGIGNDEDVTKLKISDLHPEWTNKMFAEEILPAAVRDGVWMGECAFLNIRDRHEIPVSMVLSSHKTSNGEVEVFSTISRDITERKKAEEIIRENSELYHALFEQANDAIFLMENEYFVDCNKRTLEMFDLTGEQIINQTPIRFSPEFQADGRRSAEKAMEKIHAAYAGEPQFFEWIHTRLDGTPFDTEVSLGLIKIGGRPRLQAIVRDITGRKQAEKSLRESEERYKNLFMANIDGILIADATTKKFRYANPAICRMLGYSEEELTQMGVADIHPKESFEQVIAEFEAQTSGAKITAKDLQCVRKDGQIISVSINAGTVMIDQTKYLLGIFRDVTERKNKEKQDFS
ncbi:MAG: PAS domain S-box protein [Sedimentisphaerales bacterium]|jgi:PAS domain S-box-containing protein